MPKISVIIPNYNHAEFLPQRIESVINQTWKDIEIIILDDRSTDNSRDIIERYAKRDDRIKTCFNTENSGSPFSQWNKGVKLAQGEFIWIAESDDYAECNFLERTVPVLDRYESLGLVYTQSYDVNEKNEVRGTWKRYTDDLDQDHWAFDFYSKGQEECERYMFFRATIPNASAVVFRKSVYQLVGGARESYRMCGDWLLWVEMLMKSDVYFIADPLNYFRTHTNTTRGNVFSDLTKFAGRSKEIYSLLGEVYCKYGISGNLRRKINDRIFTEWIWKFNLRSLVNRHFWRIFLYAYKVDSKMPVRLLDFVIKHLYYKWLTIRKGKESAV